MSDKITLDADGEANQIILNAKPDPREPGRHLIKSEDGAPLRGKFSLQEHAYNILLPPGSFIIIEADVAELFKESRTNDRVIFELPSADAEAFYLQNYIASAQGKSPYTALILRKHEGHALISAALYPRDLESLPTPAFASPEGASLHVETYVPENSADGASPKVEQLHNPRDLEVILRAVYGQKEKEVAPIDPDAKEAWF